MTLFIPSIDLCIENSEEYITDLVIENQELFRNTLMDIDNQTRGILGDVTISEKDKILNVAKNAELIWNPITIDINAQRITKKLYQEICELSCELEDEISNVNRDIVYCLDLLIQKIPYNVVYTCDMDIQGLLKLYKVQFEHEYSSLAESFLNYLKVLHQLCNIWIFFVVNLKDYFNVSEINEIYKFCMYEKIIIINLSNAEKGRYYFEKRYIIDEDLCFISAD